MQKPCATQPPSLFLTTPLFFISTVTHPQLFLTYPTVLSTSTVSHSQLFLQSGSHDFPNARAGMASPLARRLFAIDGITSVFFGQDFITLTKKVCGGAACKWLVVVAPIAGTHRMALLLYCSHNLSPVLYVVPDHFKQVRMCSAETSLLHGHSAFLVLLLTLVLALHTMRCTPASYRMTCSGRCSNPLASLYLILF
jgi:hypothetical protein